MNRAFSVQLFGQALLDFPQPRFERLFADYAPCDEAVGERDELIFGVRQVRVTLLEEGILLVAAFYECCDTQVGIGAGRIIECIAKAVKINLPRR
ncbi:hypothetical protein AWC27_15875 [Mycobacterium szulgai]|uniref:Uncharacterized protein n=1 Tax=Mycobacterium szulgai TaxID=1787 RepID=A0A1X2FLB8_MYCSZ|nr:hypothetical protein AWC27_15875 [Mycobacterium szulgai]